MSDEGDGHDGDDPVDDLAEFEDIADLDGVESEASDAEVEKLFTEMGVEETGEEAVWEELADGEAASNGTNGTNGATESARADDPTAGTSVAADTAVDDGEGVIVPKESYCQKCQHFSAPPSVSCENPGTEILELVDVEHFRVRGCPVVANRLGATEDVLEDG